VLVPVYSGEPVIATFDAATPSAAPSYRVAIYDLARIGGLPDTSFQFYSYVGTES